MPARLAKLWEWSNGVDSFVAAKTAGDVLLACSHDAGVWAFRPSGDEPNDIWWHAPPGDYGDLLDFAVRPAGGGVLSAFIACRESQSDPLVRCLRLADGAVLWERALGPGGVDAVAADQNLVYVRHAFRLDRRIIALDADSGNQVTALHVPERVNALVADGDGRVLFATGRTISSWDVREPRERAVVELPEHDPHRPLDLYGLVPAGDRLFAADGNEAVLCVDRSGPGARLAWRTECPGGGGAPVFDARLDRLLAFGFDEATVCLSGADGAVLWTARSQEPSSTINAGFPAFVHHAAGPFVAFPGVDEALYLADAHGGEILDSVKFGWPLEVALRVLPGRPVVVVPAGMLSAFAVETG